MNIQHCSAGGEFGNQILRHTTQGGAAWDRSNCDAATTLSDARNRLVATAAKLQRKRQLTSADEEYYGEDHRVEETIDGFATGRAFDAVVTRNHYGCLILNANRALFIDVDVDIDASRTPCRFKDARRDPWHADPSTVYNDIRTVLASEKNEGFRIYRTAAGFRILATAREFAPESEQARRLMNAVGADWHFSRLCASQNCFRARLTPKPWRCGVKRPPHPYPRQSSEHVRCFADWLTEYESACQDRATCRFLDHVGPTSVDNRVAPIVEFHDRHTRALESLSLA